MTVKADKSFNYAVNGLRGLCILLVFIYHVENSGIVPSAPAGWEACAAGLSYVFSSFRYGVEIFFMISGYVIIGSLRRHKTLKGFFTDRFLRIYPTWVPLHLLAFTIGPLLGRDLFATTHTALAWMVYFTGDLLFLPPVVPLPLVHPAAWSLSYEWCFYLLAAVAIFAARRPPAGRLLVQVVLFLMVASLISVFPRALFFVPGAFVALYEARLQTGVRFFRMPLVALVAFLLFWRATGVDAAEMDLTTWTWLQDGRLFSAVLAFFAGGYFFAGTVLQRGRFCMWLAHPWAQFYGRISYAFYLWSPLAMFPAKRIAVKYVAPWAGDWGAVVFFSVSSFVLATLISWLNWRFIEKAFTGWVRGALAPVRSAQVVQA